MNNSKHTLSFLTDEQRQAVIQEIINYYATERDEQIGIIAAGDLLDMFLEAAGVALYNKGVDDTKNHVKQRTEELLLDIDISIKKAV